MKIIHQPPGRLFKAGLIFFSVFCIMQGKAQFTVGNLSILQTGNSSSSSTNTGNPIILKEYSLTGALTYTMEVPSQSSSNALILSGTASSEGFLSLSADNKYLVFGGYAATLPNATVLPSSTGSSINRGIGLVGGAGLTSYSRVATSASFFTGNNIRGAAAASSSDVWGSGANQGANYFGTSTPVTVQNTKTNLRAIAIFNGQLYCSSQVASGTPTDIGVYSIGTGTPTTNGQAVTTVINTGTGSQPSQFYFNSAGTICYVADQRNATGGGIQKWIFSAGSWSLAYTLPTGTAAIGATGVVADFSGTNPKVYATTNESTNNRLIAITDAGASSTATTLASSGLLQPAFKGLAFSPCSMPMIAISGNTTLCAGQTLSLSAGTSTGGASTYTWSGAGTFGSVSSQSVAITNASTGIYSVEATNLCGTANATVAVIVNPLPTVVSNSYVTCTSQPFTLTASGAASYLWSTGVAAASIVVTPTVTTTYSVTGTSSTGCSKTTTAQVLITNSPTIGVTSGTVCSGSTLVLTASGANSYTWSNGVSSANIIVSPLINSIYTVTGSISGCTVPITNTASATVIPIPTIAIGGSTLYCGSAITLTASGATSYLWNSILVGPTISISTPVTATYSVEGTGSNGCVSSASISVASGTSPVLTATAVPPFLCADIFNFASVFSASGAATYSWSNGMTGSPINITQAGNYTVTGLDASGCSSTVQINLPSYICEGIESLLTNEEMILSPNPTSGQLQIAFNSSDQRSIVITDLLGKVLYSAIVEEPGISIDVSGFKKGVYHVQILSGNRTVNQRLLIE